MNPFDLPGPEFIQLYLVFGAVVIAALRVLLPRGPADDGAPVEGLEDSLELACLKGGPDGVIRVALLSLLDRRLLQARSGKLRAGPADPGIARRSIEQLLLRTYATEGAASLAFESGAVQQAAQAILSDLQRRGLAQGASVSATRRGGRRVAIALLLGVAAIKLVIALARGHHNVLFLVIAAALLAIGAFLTGADPMATRKGVRALAEARSRFERLRGRAGDLRPGGMTNELAVLAAVFGFAALPPLATDLLVEAHLAKTSGLGGSSCGSSCGSSSCGGGCGGGCGGCS